MAIGNRPPRSVLLPVLGGLVVLAWMALWWLGQSDYGWLFHRHGVAHHHPAPALPGGVETGLFLAGWLVMTVAMMLPTTVPLINVFRRMTSARQRSAGFTALLLAGYLAAWLVFGVAALALLSLLQLAIEFGGWLDAQTWMLSMVLFVAAGAFQFSKLKYACLDKCRTPAGFVISHWHGRRPALESFKIGWSHGLFCVGCCWALMLLMFAVSTASLAWMLVLALVMAVEKNVPWGRRASAPLGVVLLIFGISLGAYHAIL